MIVLVGRSGAGKSTLAKSIEKYNGYKAYEIGDYIKRSFISENCNEAQYQQKDLSSKRIEYVKRNITKFGKLYFLKSMLSEIEDVKIILCGVRSQEELLYLCDTYSNIVSIGIQCDEDKLFTRYLKREQNRMTEEQINSIFLKRQKMEQEMGIYQTIKLCSHIIDTSLLDKKQTFKAVVDYLNEIEKGG